MTWQRLLRASGIAIVVLLLSAAAGFRDVEAAALALGGVVGLALLRLRTGLLGELGLGLLAADVAAWMAPGAVSNLTHREPWIATALPATLAVASLVALFSMIALLTGRRRPASNRLLPRAVGALAVVTILAANVAGAAAQSDRGSPARPGDVSVTAQHVRFIPDLLEARAGRIGLTVSNLDLFWHTFTIRELGVNVRVPVQGERRTVFTARAGTYEFVCAIPGHAQAGMKGKIVVG